MNEVIEVNGEKYRKIDNSTTKKQIVVLQRGWVIVGDVSQDGDYLTIDNAAVIRVWGTTKGLGEIAMSGPTSKTKLDPCPANTVHVLTTVTRMDCDQANWNG
jgi:hypothetical protein